MPPPLLGSAVRRRLVLSLLLGLLAMAPAALAQDVISLRRVLISPERLPQEMERLKQGILVQLPRAEFEERVRQALQAVETLKKPPRLTETRYYAVLSDSALVGVGRWEILHSASGPGLLPLPSLSLTLRGQPRSDKGEPALGEFDGKSLGLLLSESGRQSVDLDWSARGEVRPDGLSFELDVPASPASSFELALPPGWVASVPEGVLLTGPQTMPREDEPGRETLMRAMAALVRAEPRLAKAVQADARLWTIHCGGVSRLLLTLRPTDRPGRLLVQRQQTTQTLFPDALEARYEMDLETLNQGVREVICECDPGLRPYAVSLRNLDSWDLQPGSTPEAPSRLHLHLTEAIHEGALRIACLAPLRPVGKTGDKAVAWSSPAVRVLQAVPRGETLILKVHPELRMEGWYAGGFRLTETATETDAETQVSWQRLKLEGGGVTPEGKQPARPGAQLQSHPIEFRARQLAWWQPTLERSRLTLRMQYEVSLGQLFQLPVQLPAGWDVEQVEMSPAGLLGSSQVRREKNRAVLLVDLLRPLSAPARGSTESALAMARNAALSATAPGSAAGAAGRDLPGAALSLSGTLTVTLGAAQGKASSREFTFPDAIPLGARFREGVFAIGVDGAQVLADLKTTAVVGDAREDGPWGKEIPTYSFPYREQPPRGVLTLRQRPPEIRARCGSEVTLNDDRAMLETEVAVDVEAGTPDTVDLFVAGDDGAQWTWKAATSNPSIVRAERLPARDAASLAGTLVAPGGPRLNPLAVVTAWTALPRGRHWRLTLSRPLRPEETVRFLGTAILKPTPGISGKATYRIPLVQVPGARRLEGVVHLFVTAPDRIEVAALGLREFGAHSPARLQAQGSGTGVPSWRQFRYGPKPARLELVDRRGGKVDPHSTTGRGQIWDAQLTSWLGPDGVVQNRYTFRLTNWDQRMVRVSLPPGARLLAAGVNGRWIDSLAPSDGPDVLDLPVPRPALESQGGRSGEPTQGRLSPTSTMFEIVYISHHPSWWMWSRLEAEVPVLPLDPINLRRSWRLPPGVRPLLGDISGAETDPDSDRSGGSHPLLSPEAALPSWRDFETEGVLVIVHGRAITGLAALLSALFLALFLRCAWAKPRRLALLLWFWLAGAGVLWFWLPASVGAVALGPLLTGLACTVVAYLGFLVRRPATVSRKPKAPSTKIKLPGYVNPGAATTLLILAIAAWSWADGSIPAPEKPGPFTVYLLPEKADAPGPGTVLATPELLEQLKSIQRSSQSGIEGEAVLLGATYEGKLIPRDGPEGKPDARQVAQIDAVFQVLSLADDTTVALPVEGVNRVGPVWLDNEGATPLPVPEKPPNPARPGPVGGYALKIPKRGRHKVEMHFQAQVTSLTDTRADQTIQVTLPRLSVSRLRFQAPVGAVALQALNTQGWQRVTPAADKKTGPILEVDVGRANGPLQLTWFQDSGANNKPGRVQFQEAYVWELRGDASNLNGLIHYQISRGAVQTLSLDLPPELEVRGAEAFRVLVPPPGDSGAPVRPGDVRRPALVPVNEGGGRLSGWRVEGNGAARVLHLDFQSPANGDLAVTLDLVPRTALAPTVQLPLPVPRGEPLPGAGYLAYHAVGIEAVRQRTLGVTGSQPVDFAPFWPTGSRPSEKVLQYCCTFRREPTTPPQLQLHLYWPTPLVHAQQEVLLRVGINQVEMRATVDLAMPNNDVGLVEWELQHASPWTVAAVSGHDVRRWSQAGQRLFIWLDTAKRGTEGKPPSTRVEMSGWLSLSAQDGSPRRPPSEGLAARARLELPTLTIHAAKSQKTTLRLVPEPGVVFTPGALRGLQPVLPPGPPGSLAYLTEGLSYGGTVAVESTGEALLPRGGARLLTYVEIVERQVQFTSTLVYRLRAGETRTIQLRLRDWEGRKVELKGPGVVAATHVEPAASKSGEHVWTVDLQGSEKAQSLTLRGQVPLGNVRVGIWMPEATVVKGLTIQETWLAIPGKDLTASGERGLVRETDLSAVLSSWRLQGLLEFWAGEAQRLRLLGGAVWRDVGGHANLRLTPNVERLAEELPLRMLFAEQSSVVIDSLRRPDGGGRYWLHEANWWVQQQGRADLTVTFPGAAQVLTAAVDGAETTPLQPDAEHLRLPVSGPGGVRHVRLRWRYREPGHDNALGENELLTRPSLKPARLNGVQGGPLFWTVLVPPGYTLHNWSSEVKLTPGHGRAAQLALYRAGVQEQTLAILGEGSGEGETEALRNAALARLAWYCRSAESELGWGDDGKEQGPDGQKLSDWLAHLQSRLRQEPGRPAPQAEPAGRPGPIVAGTPYYASSLSEKNLPDATLTSLGGEQNRRALLASGQWLGVLLCVWFFSLVPYVPALVRHSWPEQVALAAMGVAWQLSAWIVVCAVVVGLALLARVVVVTRWLRR
jgi:hypothetical protein